MSETNSTSIDRRRFLGGTVAVLTAAGVVSLGARVLAQDSTPGPSGEASPSASPSASPVASAAFEVHAVDISFDPKEFTIPANTDVVVTVINAGALQHNFHIEELGVASDLLNGGETTTVTINAAPGKYEYFCSVTGHREAGMVGTLTVE